MTHSPLARLRRLWLDVHLWLGVGLMVVLIPLSVSGAILVWHDALDHALYANRYAVSGPEASQPVTAYAAAADRAFAGQAVLTQIRLPQKPGDPVVAVGRINAPPGPGGRPRTFNVWIDPPTAKVLASAEIAKTFTMVTHQLHGSLLMPGAGRRVVGWLGWAMFVSSATGLWLWWPRHAGFVKGLRWHRGGSTLFNLHHMIGFWLCLPLAVLSLTGIYISFPQKPRPLRRTPSDGAAQRTWPLRAASRAPGHEPRSRRRRGLGRQTRRGPRQPDHADPRQGPRVADSAQCSRPEGARDGPGLGRERPDQGRPARRSRGRPTWWRRRARPVVALDASYPRWRRDGDRLADVHHAGRRRAGGSGRYGLGDVAAPSGPAAGAAPRLRLDLRPHPEQVVVAAGEADHLGSCLANLQGQGLDGVVEVPEQGALLVRLHHRLGPEERRPA